MQIPLTRIEPVPVKDIWPHEERHFTPWLAENIEFLNDALDLDMEVIAHEQAIPGAGRADIVARCGEAVVIIENQLDQSDDDHFVRLLHYSAKRGANIVVWVASSFADKHRDSLSWLRQASNIDIYCVEVSAWRVGDSVAPMFRRVVPSEPVKHARLVERSEIRKYQSFYRPLVARLRAASMDHTEDPGWDTGTNFRWFATVYDDVHFGLVYGDDDGKSHAFLLFNSPDTEQPMYQALLKLRSEVDAGSRAPLEWATDDNGDAWIGVSTDGSISDPDDEKKTTHEWMFSNLMLLRDALTPHLEALVEG